MRQRFRNLLSGIGLCMAAVMLLFAVVGTDRQPVDAATVNMTTSDAGIALLKQFEGCRLTAYDDLQSNVVLTKDTVIKGTLTIGYGHTGTIDGKAIAWNTTITQQKAEELLKSDLKVFETSVNNFLNSNNIKVNQDQFDALVSFTYNVGQNKWSNGSEFRLRTYLVNGIEKYSNYEITSAFTAFNTSGGNMLTGLTRRRKVEAALFLGNPTIASYSPGEYQVDYTSSLNVRSGPGTKNEKVGTIAKGTQVTITEVSGYWGKYSGGWISLEYCECLYGSLETPVISEISNSGTGVTLTWKAVENAAMYRVYKKDSAGSWARIGQTAGTSFTDKDGLSSGTSYTYTIRCITSDGKYFESSYDTKGTQHTYIAPPVLSSAEASANGVTIKWAASRGAEKYRVYRKNSSGIWMKLGDTAGTSYTDTDVTGGTNYTYTVRCLNSQATAFTSWYDSTGISILYAAAPKLSSLEGTTNGITIKWAAAKGAEKYRVYRKNSGGSWTRIGETTGTSYTDTNVTGGTNYTYTVRCLNSQQTVFTSWYDSNGISMLYAAVPKLSSVENTANGVTVKWAASKGAEKYRVYRKSGSGSWTRLGDTTGTSYTDTTAVSGSSYTYTVRCLNANATAFTGGYDSTGLRILYIAAPKLSSLESTSGGVTIKWAASKGAEKYRVYRKNSSGSWTRLGDTTGTSYTDTSVVSGGNYTYTVRCLNANATAFTSGYNSTGLNIVCAAVPKLSSVENAANGVTIKWAASKGAVKYRVYRKNSSGSWTRLGDTTGTSYTDTTAAGGSSYTYTVRCINSNATYFTSGYNSTGLSIVYIAAPKLSSVTNVSNGVTIKWAASKGAVKYRVYRKNSSGSWTKLGDITGTSYTDTSVKKGTSYTYTVRCLNANATAFTSSYDSTGKTITYR